MSNFFCKHRVSNPNDIFQKYLIKEIRSVQRGKLFDWNKIIKAIRELIGSGCSIFCSCDSLTNISYKLMEEYDCREPSVIAAVTAFRYRSFTVVDSISLWILRTGEINYLMTVSYTKAAPSFYNPVFDEIYKGDIESMRCLLRYGIICRSTFDYNSEWINNIRKLQNYL